MAETREHTHHSMDYIEIPVTDVAVAKAFYASAFGWSFNSYGPDYAGIKRLGGGGEVGGLRKEARPSEGQGPLVVLFSNNLELTLASVERFGGVITALPFDFPGGRRFHFKDPSGNELGVWANN